MVEDYANVTSLEHLSGAPLWGRWWDPALKEEQEQLAPGRRHETRAPEVLLFYTYFVLDLKLSFREWSMQAIIYALI